MKGKRLYEYNGNVLIALGSDDNPMCVAKGCDRQDVESTAIGLYFCGVHFGQFFSEEPLEYEDWRDCDNADEWKALNEGREAL